MYVLAQGAWTTLIALGALMLTIGMLLARYHRYFSRQKKDRGPIVRTPRPEADRPAHYAGAPDEMLRWEVQMHDLARDLSGQLDSKMSALEHLIQEADRAAGRLESALDAQHPEDPPTPANQAERLQSAGIPGPRPDEKPGVRPATDQPESTERQYEAIYLLSDYGFDAGGIAQRLGSPVGEVELILGLRDKR